jgi:hypothetical protein
VTSPNSRWKRLPGSRCAIRDNGELLAEQDRLGVGVYPPSLRGKKFGNALKKKEIRGIFHENATGLQREHNGGCNEGTTGDGTSSTLLGINERRDRKTFEGKKFLPRGRNRRGETNLEECVSA